MVSFYYAVELQARVEEAFMDMETSKTENKNLLQSLRSIEAQWKDAQGQVLELERQLLMNNHQVDSAMMEKECAECRELQMSKEVDRLNKRLQDTLERTQDVIQSELDGYVNNHYLHHDRIVCEMCTLLKSESSWKICIRRNFVKQS